MKQILSLIFVLLLIQSLAVSLTSCRADPAPERVRQTATSAFSEESQGSEGQSALPSDTSTLTESDTKPHFELSEENGNLEEVLAHPWFRFHYADDCIGGLSAATDGLCECRIVDLSTQKLDCATPDGWTQIVVYYIPEKKPDGTAFTSSDYLSVGAFRAGVDGAYSFGMNFCLGNGRTAVLSQELYFSPRRLLKLKKNAYTGQYVMFAQVFEAKQMTLYLNGKAIAAADSISPEYTVAGNTARFHHTLALNGFVRTNASDRFVTDQYERYRIRLLYTTGYACAADGKAVEAFYRYFAAGETLPVPDRVISLDFEDRYPVPELKADDDAPSNYRKVLENRRFELDFTEERGLRGIKVIHLGAKKENGEFLYWRGPMTKGRCSVGLYYIPDAVYGSDDYLGLMQNKDFVPGGFDSSLRFNLGTGLISTGNAHMVNPMISAYREVHPTGWTLFVSSFDGKTLEVYCNNELILRSDLLLAGTQQTYVLGYDSGHPEVGYPQRLQQMVLNGYAHVGETTLEDPEYVADDLYEKYGIYMLYARFYACAPNRNAATEIYEEVMRELDAYLNRN